MRKLGLGEYAQIAEIVAAVAVVLSLVYVGIGLRENTAAVRSASVQAITNASIAALTSLNASPDLSRIRRLGDQDQSQLTEDEQYRYFLLYRQLWLSFQNVFLQQDLGVIGSELWGTYQRVICSEIAEAGVRATWQSHAGVLNPDFVSVVESCSTF